MNLSYRFTGWVEFLVQVNFELGSSPIISNRVMPIV